MRKLLHKLNFITEFTISLNVPIDNFEELFRSNTENDIGPLSDAFDIFKSSKKNFKGNIWKDHFYIKKTGTINPLGFPKTMMRAIGKFQVRDSNNIDIELEINPFNEISILLFYLIAVLIYIIGFISILTEETSIYSFLFLVLYSILMLGIPYIVFRVASKNLKTEIISEIKKWLR